MSARLYARCWPTEGAIGASDLEALRAGMAPAVAGLTWGVAPFGDGRAEDVGFVFALDLPETDPDAMFRDVKQGLALAKWVAVQRPDWWVECWDDLGLLDASFGGTLSLLGGWAVVRDTGERDDEVEQRLADQIAKVRLRGLDLGPPPGVPEEVPALAAAVAAKDPEIDALWHDEDRMRLQIAWIDHADGLGRPIVAEAWGRGLDAFAPEQLRDLILDDFQAHAGPVRRQLGRVLGTLDRAAAIDLGTDVLFSGPKGLALDDAAAALVPYAEDPELIAILAGVVEEEVPPGPGTRLEGACADLLLRTGEGSLAVARRARRDRDQDPIAWWAVRKLLERPRPETLPTALLYGAAGRVVPEWLATALAAADPSLAGGARLSAERAAALAAEEEAALRRR